MPLTAEPWTLQEFYERYERKVKAERHVSLRTWTNAEQWALKDILAFRGERATLADLTEPWMTDYESARKPTLSPYTWNSRRATLRAIGNRAVAWKWISINPFQCLSRAKTVKKRPKRLLQEQLPLVLQAIPNPFWKLVTLLLYATGLRQGELCALRKTSVRRQQGYLDVETNKENKPKVIAITPEIAQILDALAPLTVGSPYVVGRHGGPLHPEAVKNYYRWVSKKVGFPVSPHRFRHSHGSHRMEAGDNLKAVSDTLGHADIRTTADFYLDLNLAAQRAAMSRLPIGELLNLVQIEPQTVAKP